MSYTKLLLLSSFLLYLNSFTFAQDNHIPLYKLPYKIYPAVNDSKPELPSPFKTEENEEYILAFTKDNTYAIAEVTLSNERSICKQLIVDSLDFPALAKTGLHSEQELENTKFITGRSLAEITHLGRPNGLSQGGFMAEDETILSVIQSDNQIVRELGLTHPQLAKPLFHILNLMDRDN